jgi:hypothetical protein
VPERSWANQPDIGGHKCAEQNQSNQEDEGDIHLIQRAPQVGVLLIERRQEMVVQQQISQKPQYKNQK